MLRFWISVFLYLPVVSAVELVDTLITARIVVTMDARRQVIRDGAVAVRGRMILETGPRRTLITKYKPTRRVDKPNALLLPGLINTHTHAPMSLLRGIADDLRLQQWLESYIFPAEGKNVTPEFVRVGTQLACLEMLLGGTTTYTDMYYFEDTIAEATRQAGMRGVLGQTIIGFPAPDYKTPQEALAGADRFMAKYKADPLIVPAVAPHAIYTNSPETLKAAREIANRHGLPLLIHLSETQKENDDAATEHKMSPTRYLESLGILTGRTVAAHAVFTDAQDWTILKQRGTGVAHCPSSNMKLASGVAPVTDLLAAGVAVGLGPDGPAGSNNDFSLFEEIDLAAKLAKAFRKDPTVLPAMTGVEMATILGAKALGLERQIGSLEAGKQADLIAINLDSPHATPEHDPYSMLAYSLKSSDVEDVMILGRWIVRNKQVLTINSRQVLARASELRAKVEQSIKRN